MEYKRALLYILPTLTMHSDYFLAGRLLRNLATVRLLATSYDMRVILVGAGRAAGAAACCRMVTHSAPAAEEQEEGGGASSSTAQLARLIDSTVVLVLVRPERGS